MNHWSLTVIVVLGIFCSILHEYHRRKRLKKHFRIFFENRSALPHKEFGAEFYPEPMRDIAVRGRAILGHHLPYDVMKTFPSDRMNIDLKMDELDSMSQVEFILELEQEFKVSIQDQEAQKLDTLDDVIQCVAGKVNEKA